jgi:hypothetical protein
MPENATKPTDDKIAAEYRERRTEVDADDLQYSRFTGLSFVDGSRRDDAGKTAIEFEYTTSHGNTKVVRAIQPTRASSFDADRFPSDVDFDSVSAYTFHDDGDAYAYTDDGRLWSRGDSYRCVGDVDAVYRVDFPESAPVTGAVQDGVSVTVHYRSKRSGNLKTMRIDDVSVDWEGDRVQGYHARRDRTVEVRAVFERGVVTKGSREEEVGKCARIDFPAGHAYTVDVYGVADDDADSVHDSIESVVSKAVGVDDRDVDVTHDGRIDD